jgi:type VI secretion system secreted protein VgrG
MASADHTRYEFTISGLPDDLFHVVQFTGKEGLSQLYEFDILLASANQEIDLDAVQTGLARITVIRPDKQALSLGGIILNFDQLEQNHGLTFYRAYVVPKAWWLTQIRTTQIFLDDEMHHVLEAILKQADLRPGIDYEFRLALNYPKRDWICQYDETHWNFFNRLMERGGLYFFFEQTSLGEKLVVTDTAMSHTPLPGEGELKYRPPSALGESTTPETARSFRCALHRTPREVLIRDYNYRTLQQVEGRHEVSEHGLGTVYRHVEDLRSNAEARYVAKARAEGMACLGRRFHGETAAPFLRPGFTFNLSGHYRSDFNRDYITIEMTHEGNQQAYIATLAGRPGQSTQDKPFYRNTFVAIPSDIQFRPEPKTPRPIVAGPITAWIDAEGEGKYAEVDALGRYKVAFPMDLSGRKDGKASHWIRMMTPYSGNGHGLHLPLHKGTEVLVIFRDGNPDKPVIAGAVPNQYQKMVVTEENATQCRLTTAGDNRFHIEDRDGGQGVLLSTPVKGTYLSLGSHMQASSGNAGGTSGESSNGAATSFSNTSLGSDNQDDHKSDDDKGTIGSEDGFTIFTDGWLNIKATETTAITLINKNELVVGLFTDHVLGGRTEMTLGGKFELTTPWLKAITPEATEIKEKLTKLTDRTTAVENNVTKVTSDITTITNTTTAIRNDLTTLDTTRVAVVETTINTHGQRIDTVDQEVKTCQNSIKTVQSEVKVVAEEVNTKASSTEVSESVNQVRTEVNKMSTSITSIEDSVTKLGSQETIIKNEIANICMQMQII